MKVVETIPGKSYAVECVGEVTVTNTETGAVVAQGDGSGQVLFTACSSSYTVSDDAAKVKMLFKSAPRLRLALLQGGAGGWLPKGFTELEYLESSGTQFIDTGLILESPCRLKIVGANLAKNQNNIYVCGCTNTDDLNTRFYITIYNENPASRNVAYYCIGDSSGLALSFDINTALFHSYSLDNASFSIDGEAFFDTKYATFTKCTYSSFLFARNGKEVITFVGAVAGAEFYQNDQIIGHFVPVLNADGQPGLWDKVSRRFYGNVGTGTFGYALKGQGASRTYSLRNRNAVAPSGVYARPTGDNELEILADTEETTGEDWEWFANTAEAYEHFGIVPEGEEFLTE